MTVRRCALFILAALVACASGAADAPPSDTAASTPASLAQIAWLAGSWRGESEGTHQEEHWLAPDGGLMLGLHRDVSAKGRASFEYLRIEQHADGVVYQASPGGAPPTPFRLTEATATRAVFSNPEHDFPKRIIYTLSGNSLTARIEGDGPEGMEWTWKRSAFLR